MSGGWDVEAKNLVDLAWSIKKYILELNILINIIYITILMIYMKRISINFSGFFSYEKRAWNPSFACQMYNQIRSARNNDHLLVFPYIIRSTLIFDPWPVGGAFPAIKF